MTKPNFSTPLLDQIIQYCTNPKTPFHMPAHAGGHSINPKIKDFLGINTFKADLTELDELDNLQNPTGIIKETQDKIASIFDAKASYLLVNGSTVGLMALLLLVAKENEKVLVARNCHRSIINGLILSGAKPVWLLPEWLPDWQLFGTVTPETLDRQLEKKPDIKAVIITNPTYEGIVSDTRSLASICNKYEIPLIVDEAHGGHWKFHPDLPEDALSCEADATVQSFHKTCGSLSQSSLLHISKKSRFQQNEVAEFLKLLQSTSPSYLLMASLDAATSFIAGKEGRTALDTTYKLSLALRNKLKSLSNVNVLTSDTDFQIDPTRFFISINNLTGEHLAEIIETEHKIAIESFNNSGNLFFINLGNSQNDLDKLFQAIEHISQSEHSDKIQTLPPPRLPNIKMTPREAFFSSSRTLPVKYAIGEVARFPVVKCPPGRCIVLPGELISKYHLNFLPPDEKIEVIC